LNLDDRDILVLLGAFGWLAEIWHMVLRLQKDFSQTNQKRRKILDLPPVHPAISMFFDSNGRNRVRTAGGDKNNVARTTCAGNRGDSPELFCAAAGGGGRREVPGPAVELEWL
jgi:hypothetical protein